MKRDGPISKSTPFGAFVEAPDVEHCHMSDGEKSWSAGVALRCVQILGDHPLIAGNRRHRDTEEECSDNRTRRRRSQNCDHGRQFLLDSNVSRILPLQQPQLPAGRSRRFRAQNHPTPQNRREAPDPPFVGL